MSNVENTLLVREPPITSRPWWQKRTFTISVAVLGLLLIIVVMTINVAKYETHLANGDTVLLELAPVDPRGFMQGDYMALSYALERDVFDTIQPKYENSELVNSEQESDEFESDFRSYKPSEGYVIVKIDQNNVGQFVRLADNNKLDDLATNEIPIHYRIRNGSVQLATNAFFFQEGHAEAFEAAEYGLFRVNNKGEPLLTNMVDGEFEMIKGKSNQVNETQIDDPQGNETLN
ncbi:GDYXXLXY domain-containing protein [Psychrobacter sp. 72-O-c]|uniref:GDYXXLXY domain-containing protein n=1 Tax=Psychrobacter sp. 72-O-c TaxID=2774125 RepID=UPI001918E0A5|nr:GDYXXLXY domain-containing protein [Psychrobacter sp. 72-O-c]